MAKTQNRRRTAKRKSVKRRKSRQRLSGGASPTSPSIDGLWSKYVNTVWRSLDVLIYYARDIENALMSPDRFTVFRYDVLTQVFGQTDVNPDIPYDDWVTRLIRAKPQMTDEQAEKLMTLIHETFHFTFASDPDDMLYDERDGRVWTPDGQYQTYVGMFPDEEYASRTFKTWFFLFATREDFSVHLHRLAGHLYLSAQPAVADMLRAIAEIRENRRKKISLVDAKAEQLGELLAFSLVVDSIRRMPPVLMTAIVQYLQGTFKDEFPDLATRNGHPMKLYDPKDESIIFPDGSRKSYELQKQYFGAETPSTATSSSTYSTGTESSTYSTASEASSVTSSDRASTRPSPRSPLPTPPRTKPKSPIIIDVDSLPLQPPGPPFAIAPAPRPVPVLGTPPSRRGSTAVPTSADLQQVLAEVDKRLSAAADLQSRGYDKQAAAAAAQAITLAKLADDMQNILKRSETATGKAASAPAPAPSQVPFPATLNVDELAEKIAKRVLELQPPSSGAFIPMMVGRNNAKSRSSGRRSTKSRRKSLKRKPKRQSRRR